MSMPINADHPLKIYTTTWCGDCRRSKRWLDANNVAYVNINIESDASAAEYVSQVNAGSLSVPTIIFPDGSILVEPSNTQLASQVRDVLGIVTSDAR
jgi:mycoredoxin